MFSNRWSTPIGIYRLIEKRFSSSISNHSVELPKVNIDHQPTRTNFWLWWSFKGGRNQDQSAVGSSIRQMVGSEKYSSSRSHTRLVGQCCIIWSIDSVATEAPQLFGDRFTWSRPIIAHSGWIHIQLYKQFALFAFGAHAFSMGKIIADGTFIGSHHIFYIRRPIPCSLRPDNSVWLSEADVAIAGNSHWSLGQSNCRFSYDR